jgi:hypothetical protein
VSFGVLSRGNVIVGSGFNFTLSLREVCGARPHQDSLGDFFPICWNICI